DKLAKLHQEQAELGLRIFPGYKNDTRRRLPSDRGVHEMPTLGGVMRNISNHIGLETNVALSSKRLAIQRGVLRYYRKNGRTFPWRESGRTPYEILIAEMLLRRTTASAVAKIYNAFVGQFPSVTHMKQCSLREI